MIVVHDSSMEHIESLQPQPFVHFRIFFFKEKMSSSFLVFVRIVSNGLGLCQTEEV